MIKWDFIGVPFKFSTFDADGIGTVCVHLANACIKFFDFKRFFDSKNPIKVNLEAYKKACLNFLDKLGIKEADFTDQLKIKQAIVKIANGSDGTNFLANAISKFNKLLEEIEACIN